VDGAMRGRVMSLYGMIYRGVPAIGALAVGGAAEYIGLQGAIAGGGIVCIGALIWVFGRRKSVIKALEGNLSV